MVTLKVPNSFQVCLLLHIHMYLFSSQWFITFLHSNTLSKSVPMKISNSHCKKRVVANRGSERKTKRKTLLLILRIDKDHSNKRRMQKRLKMQGLLSRETKRKIDLRRRRRRKNRQRCSLKTEGPPKSISQTSSSSQSFTLAIYLKSTSNFNKCSMQNKDTLTIERALSLSSHLYQQLTKGIGLASISSRRNKEKNFLNCPSKM